ncbi:MAG: hypothetical protein NWR30_01500 [Salibacteraceae bacterium]|nr:hypothetical protein [Salibacteraceae bacterium]
MSTQQDPEKSLEALQKQKKTLATYIVMAASLTFGFLLYFIWSLYSGTWQASNTLGITGIGFLGVINSILATRLAAVNKEIKGRETA